MSFLFPKAPKAPPPPPTTPTKADASVLEAGQRASAGYSSAISTGQIGGLQRKAKTQKSSLIGGA